MYSSIDISERFFLIVGLGDEYRTDFTLLLLSPSSSEFITKSCDIILSICDIISELLDFTILVLSISSVTFLLFNILAI